MFGIFNKKKEKEEIKQLKKAVQTGFNTVKQDMDSVSKWIKHLDGENSKVKDEVMDFMSELSTIREEIESLKNMIAIVDDPKSFKQMSKQKQTVFNKQLVDESVLNSVQTAVQTTDLEKLTANERAIVYVLVNTDMKLSYEDIAAMLGKRKSTIRGQINSIRQKKDNIIKEIVGENNKKRVYIPKKTKEVLLKKRKVRAKKSNTESDDSDHSDYEEMDE